MALTLVSNCRCTLVIYARKRASDSDLALRKKVLKMPVASSTTKTRHSMDVCDGCVEGEIASAQACSFHGATDVEMQHREWLKGGFARVGFVRLGNHLPFDAAIAHVD